MSAKITPDELDELVAKQARRPVHDDRGPTLLGAELPAELAAYPFSDEQSRRFERAQERDQERAAEQDLTDLRSMANKALQGVYGTSAKTVAVAWCRDLYGQPETVAGIARREDLEALRVMLRQVPDRVSG